MTALIYHSAQIMATNAIDKPPNLTERPPHDAQWATTPKRRANRFYHDQISTPSKVRL